MIGKEIVEEKDVTLPEVKSILNKRAKDSELSYEQTTSLEYAKEFGKTKITDARKAVKEIQEVEKIDEATATMIVDIKPQDKDDLTLILEKKRFTLSDGDIKKILEIIKKIE